MTQEIITGLIVCASAGWIGYRLWRWALRRLRGQKSGGCGGGCSCGSK